MGWGCMSVLITSFKGCTMYKIKAITVIVAMVMTLISVGCSDVVKDRAESIDSVKVVFEIAGIPYEKVNIPIQKRSVNYKLQLIYFDGTRETVDDTVRWSSSDTSVATIEQNGTVQLLQVGETLVHASVNIDGTPFETQTLLNVVEYPVENLSIFPPLNELPKGTSRKYTAMATFRGFDIPIPVQATSWSTSAPDDIKITENGITATVETNASSRESNVSITTMYYSNSASMVLEITPPVLKEINITSIPENQVSVGVDITFHAVGTLSDGTSAGDITSDLSWKENSDETILKFYTIPKYKAQGVSPGEVNVTASTKFAIPPVRKTVLIKVVQ